MGQAIIAAKFPIKVEIEAGKIYSWCSCGLSKKQPYCDGSHKSGDLRPKVFKADKSESAWFCQCKQSTGSPYCDGTHKKL